MERPQPGAVDPEEVYRELAETIDRADHLSREIQAFLEEAERELEIVRLKLQRRKPKLRA